MSSEKQRREIRKFAGGQLNDIRGASTARERVMARRVGYIREFQPTDAAGNRLTVLDVVRERQKRLNSQWVLIAGLETHEAEPEPPEGYPDAILMGWVKVNAQQPGAPIWLAERKEG